MAVAQFRAIWSVAGGGTGYSVFHAVTDAVTSTNAAAFAGRVRTFFAALASRLPDDVIITFDTEVLQLSADGTLQSVTAITTQTAVSGSGANNYSRAAGGRIDWSTSAIVSGRRLKGRTYIVPIVSAEFGNTGLLTPTCITALETAANAMVAGLDSDGIPLGVWSRTHAYISSVDSGSAPAEGAILRSRRD